MWYFLCISFLLFVTKAISVFYNVDLSDYVYLPQNEVSILYCSFVHFDQWHLIGNIGAAWILYWIWKKEMQSEKILGLILCTLFCQSLLPFLTQQPVWGASGLIHCLFAFFAIKHGIGQLSKVTIQAAIALKLTLDYQFFYQQLSWASHVSGSLVGIALGYTFLIFHELRCSQKDLSCLRFVFRSLHLRFPRLAAMLKPWIPPTL